MKHSRWKAYSPKRLAHWVFWLALPWLGPRPASSVPPVVTPLQENAVFESWHDGDTAKAKTTDGKIWTLRLAGIDTPEVGQPFAQKAQRRLKSLSEKKNCQIQRLEQDRYQRHVALIWCEGIFVNQKLVEEGLAYAYWHLGFPESSHRWAEEAERKARTQRLGLHRRGQKPLSPHRYRSKKF